MSSDVIKMYLKLNKQLINLLNDCAKSSQFMNLLGRKESVPNCSLFTSAVIHNTFFPTNSSIPLHRDNVTYKTKQKNASPHFHVGNEKEVRCFPTGVRCRG